MPRQGCRGDWKPAYALAQRTGHLFVIATKIWDALAGADVSCSLLVETPVSFSSLFISLPPPFFLFSFVLLPA